MIAVKLKMKTPLLFCLILIAFWGCGKVKKQYSEPKKVHEINVGILESIGPPDSVNYKFYRFQTINLINDSIYHKQHNYSFLDSVFADSIKTFAKKSSFQKDTIVQKFISEIQKIKNGDRFLCGPNHYHGIHSPLVHAFYYKKGSKVKYFFYQDGNQVIDDFLKLIEQDNVVHKLEITPRFLNDKDEQIANFLAKHSDLKSLPYLPVPVQMKIKFIPPVKKN